MKKNMGWEDSAVRFVLAATIAALYFTNVITGTWAVILGVLAAIFVLTAFISFCPLYTPFGINTRRRK